MYNSLTKVIYFITLTVVDWWNSTIVLTETEHNLLMMSAQGYTTEEIADRLFRSVDTMKYHRKKLFRKLGVETISEALATVMSSNEM